MKKKILSYVLMFAMFFTAFTNLTFAQTEEGVENIYENDISIARTTESIISIAADSIISAADLLASYPLLEGTKDVSGNGRDAEAIGNITYGDGVTLPGGSNSTTNYVKLPSAIFVGQDNLTISVWVKSNMNPGNYSTLFFGTAANSSRLPENYWLFNSSNPDGNFKSVITNSVSSTAPWSTEVGVIGPATSGNKNIWTHYTTVITPTSITGYINGVSVGTTAKTRTTTDYGTTLEAYIGRSNYLGDPTFAGSLKDLRIYGTGLDAGQVQEIYTASQVEAQLHAAKNALTLPKTTKLISAINLPLVGINETTISWESSNPAAVSGSGEVNLTTEVQTAILTATINLNGKVATKEFTVTTAKQDEVMNIIIEQLRVPYILTQSDKLPTTIESATVEWLSDNGVIDTNGNVIAPSNQGLTDVTLTATITLNTQVQTKEFIVKVIESSPDYILSYIRSGSTRLSNSMHLGYSTDEQNFTALNNNTGVLFAKFNLNEGPVSGTTKLLVNPYIFRMKNTGFGVVATRTNSGGAKDQTASSSVLLFTSDNLTAYKEEGLISLNTTKVVNNPICEYDSALKTYRISWVSEDGIAYYNTTDDFVTISQPIECEEVKKEAISTSITSAIPSNIIPVTKAEGKAITNKLTQVVNTSVSRVELTTPAGNALTATDLGKVTATYSDGSTTQKAVVWSQSDLEKIDFSQKGIYTVNGTIKQTSYPFPMISNRADPNVLKYNGKYYFIATDEDGQNKLKIRVADTISGLVSGTDQLIFTANTSGEMSGCIWAPELHVIDGELYILFAAGRPTWNTVQAHVMKLKSNGDPLKATDWETPIKFLKKDNAVLYTDGITLDMTYFEENGKHYVIWAQRFIGTSNGNSDLFIGEINPAEPWKLISDPVLICTPEYGWDRNTTDVVEGPFILKHNGKLFVTFSGSNIDDTYSVGLLTAVGENLLQSSSWEKTNYPILTSESVTGQYGPGHNSYTVDEDGNDINIFHAKATKTGSRDMGARRVHWAADGTPILSMTDAREIAAANRNVKATIIVGEGIQDNKAELSQLIILHADKKAEVYTAESFAIFETAYNQAKIVFAKEDATTDEVQGVISKLNDAVSKLVVKPDQNAEKMILHYEFNGSLSSGTVNDSSGKNSHGTIVGSGASIKDGSLTLPGGTGAYVQLPTGMFDGQDTLTITTWLKNETGKANYAAMFFGTGGASPPAQYWLFNPCNPSGYFKSVITNGNTPTAPYNTESGISPTTASRGILGPTTDNSWAFYTTVIEPTSITAYYNGNKIGRVSTTRTVSEFGQNLVAYIGRSTYPDVNFKGSLRDVKVYTTALNEESVKEEMNKTILAEDKEILRLTNTNVMSDIVLPAVGENGSQITWKSSDSTYITDDGKVTRPAKGEGDVNVTMTATLTWEGAVATKAFNVMILENDPEKDLAKVKDTFELGIAYVTEDIVLPSMVNENITISWKTSNESLISTTGKVTRPQIGEGDQKATLTAILQLGEAKAEKAFEVTIAESTYGYLLSYVLSGDTDRTDSLHIAYSQEGQNFTALHNNKAIRYTTKGAKKMGSPVIFRKADGTYGLITSDNNNSASIILMDSKDLLSYTNERYVEINNQGIKVQHPSCRFDTSINAYRIDFVGSNGKSYKTTTTDFGVFTPLEETNYTKTVVNAVTLPTKAIETSVIALTRAEYDRVVAKYSRVTNTGIQTLQDVKIKTGNTFKLPEKVTATYNYGLPKDMGVVWDEEALSNVDINKEGSYTVTGTVQQTKYPHVLVEERADPWVVLGDDGYYYFTGSYPVRGDRDPEGYDRVILRRSRTIEGLSNAQEITIWHEKDSAACFRYIWAPEMHNIDGKWYILYTASRSSNVWNIRPHMLACEGDGDPYKPENWVERGQVKAASGDTFAFTNFSLDMNYFENNGKHYVIWAEKPGNISNLYMATIDPSAPWQLTSKAILMTTPDYAWEWKGGTIINEGPAVLKRDGKVILAYSAAAVDESYCVGILSADQDADLMNIASWTKNAYPLLTNDDLIDQYGPGHNSFTVDAYGNIVIVYHARPTACGLGQCEFASSSDLNDPCRHARVKNVNFAADGTPILNMTYEEELAEQFKRVSITVNVSNDTTIPEITIKAIKEQKVTTKVGTAPILPAQVEVTYSDATTKQLPVIWNAVAASQYAAAGSFLVEGTVAGTTLKAKTTVTVTAVQIPPTSVESVTLDKLAASVTAGQNVQLTATVLPADATNKAVAWSTSDAAVATVEAATGKVTAITAGTATITATTADGRKTAACVVTVTAANIPVAGVTLNKASASLVVGNTETLAATVAPANATNKAVTWSTSNAAVAIVDQAGKVTAITAGTATITGTTADGSKTAACVVTVSNSSGGSGRGGSSSPVKPVVTPPVIPTETTQNNKGVKVKISLTDGTASEDGVNIQLTVKPYIQEGRTMVGVRDMATLLNVDSKNVIWNAKDKSILIKTSDKEVKLVIGQYYAIVNGEKVTLDVAPQIKEGRTVLPIAHIARVLGINVTFDIKTKEVIFSIQQ